MVQVVQGVQAGCRRAADLRLQVRRGDVQMRLVLKER